MDGEKKKFRFSLGYLILAFWAVLLAQQLLSAYMQPAEDVGLSLEHPDEVQVVPVRGEDPLDDDVARVARRTEGPRLVDLRHPPDAEGIEELVAPQPGAAPIGNAVAISSPPQSPQQHALLRLKSRANGGDRFFATAPP